MAYRVLFKAPAKQQIERLDASIRQRIFKAVMRLSASPHIGKPLRGTLVHYWSYRVGNWRVIYEIHESTITVVVVAIGHRKEIYDAVRDILTGIH